MKDAANGALDKFTDVLYGIAPGFVALAAIMLADPDNKLGIRGLSANDAGLLGVGAGILLGLVSYALHLAVLEDLMMRIVLWWVRMFGDKKYDIAELTRARWERSGSAGKTAAAQAALDETYLWLFFLYCSGYLLLGSGVLLLCRVKENGGWVLLAGFVFLGAAVYGDFKATRHEVWLIQHWPPTAPEVGAEALPRPEEGTTHGTK